MRFSDNLLLALQNVRRTRLRTALTATGVAIGTAAVVTLLAFGNGVQAIAVGRAASFGAVTTALVFPQPNGTPAITPATVAAIRAMAHVKAVQTALTVPTLRLRVGSHVSVVPAQAQSPLGLATNLAHGSPALGDDADGVLLPLSLARGMAADPLGLVGQAARLTAGSDIGNGRQAILVAGPDRDFSTRVAGIWDDGAAGPGDKATPPIILSGALGATIDATFAGKSVDAYLASSGYSNLTVVTDDARSTADVAASIKKLGFRVVDRADLLGQINLFFNIIKAALGGIGGIALLVAAVGIANTMVMTVMERTREIGIMKALGAEPGSVRAMFLMETGLTGLLGGIAGLLLAAAAGAIGNVAFQRFMQRQNPDVHLPHLFVVTAELMAFGVAIAVAVSLAGGFLPARRAVRLDPLDALRYE
jgi:putative ABC transport system permease protein